MYVKAKVTPNSKRESVTKENSVLFRIEVKEPSERNLANKRAKELLQAELGLSPGEVRLVAGHRSRNKVFDVLTKEV